MNKKTIRILSGVVWLVAVAYVLWVSFIVGRIEDPSIRFIFGVGISVGLLVKPIAVFGANKWIDYCNKK